MGDVAMYAQPGIKQNWEIMFTAGPIRYHRQLDAKYRITSGSDFSLNRNYI